MAQISRNRILSELTDTQREVVLVPGGPMLVIAGAGSGSPYSYPYIGVFDG